MDQSIVPGQAVVISINSHVTLYWPIIARQSLQRYNNMAYFDDILRGKLKKPVLSITLQMHQKQNLFNPPQLKIPAEQIRKFASV